MVNWTEERVQRMKLLSKDGFSASAIAKELGPSFTKGMVAGKMRRIAMSAKPARSTRPESKTRITAEKPKLNAEATPRRPAPRPKRALSFRADHPENAVQPPMAKGMRLYDLLEGHCRWPLGEDVPAKLFCGAPAVPSKAWCEHHYRMAYGHGPMHQSKARHNQPDQMLLQASAPSGRGLPGAPRLRDHLHPSVGNAHIQPPRARLL